MNNWSWILESPIIPALGWSVLHSIWQAFIVGIIAYLGLKVISIQKAHARYVFSYIMLLTIGGLFIWNFNHQYQIASIKTTQVEIQRGYKETPINDAAEILPPVLEKNQIALEEQAPQVFSVKQNWLAQLKALFSKSQSFFKECLPWLAMIWIVGVLFFGTRLIASWWYLKHWAKSSAKPIGKEWQNKLELLKSQLGIHRAIRFLESAKISEPITFGWFKPVIMIPLGMLSQLQPDQVEAVILHELAHIRRFDYTANLLQSFIEILLFFHPVVWWISRKIRESREDCCDDIAADFCHDRHHYANSLLQVQKYSLTFKNQLAMAATGNSGRLTARIQRLFINTNPENNSSKKRISPLLSLLLVFSFLSLYAFTDIFSFGKKTVSVSADKMNVFYIGVDNPITAAVAGIPTEKVRLSSDDVILEAQGDGHYVAKANKPGKAVLTVSGEGLETTEVEFRVKRLPDPKAVLSFPGHKSSGGSIKAEDFKKVKGVSLDFGNFAFDVDMQVVGYEMTWVAKRGDPVAVKMYQGDFDVKALELIDQAAADDIFYFDQVTVRSKEYAGQDEEVDWKVNSMVFKLK